ncbi:hypothetical protein ID007_004300 [Salmonella enterica]|nr:hypothetical protein [Salmonella enterica]
MNQAHVTTETLRSFGTMSEEELQEYANVFQIESIGAYNEHKRLWQVVKKLIERDIVNGAPAHQIAQAVDLLQRGEGRCFDLYLLHNLER